MKRVVILTGSELRHTFFRKWLALAEGVEVVRTYCEGLEKSLEAIVEKQADNAWRMKHLRAREQSEEDFFRLYVTAAEDRSGPKELPKGDINLPEHVSELISLKPDLLVAYGCSIIREPLLQAFSGRFLNVHLGLSPYYRGSGTNYWPLVNGEPEFVGATFMHIDAGVDTGEIIHQIRARIAPADTPVQIGNRLIVDMAPVYRDVILRFEKLGKVPQPAEPPNVRYYKKKDYTEESVKVLYQKFSENLVDRYLTEEAARTAKAPLVINPVLQP
jgi:phosphoribosylglycinamide formyltransferase 1